MNFVKFSLAGFDEFLIYAGLAIAFVYVYLIVYMIWKYSLHEPWKGFIPYYMVFSRESQTLEHWFADEAEYMRQQQLWLQAIPPNQKLEVDVRIKQPGR